MTPPPAILGLNITTISIKQKLHFLLELLLFIQILYGFFWNCSLVPNTC